MPNRVSIKLTPEQVAQVKQTTGKDAKELEFSVEQLEDRIAPLMPKPF